MEYSQVDLKVYSLVFFKEENSFYVCHNKNIHGNFAKWKNGCRYEAQVLIRSHFQKTLEDFRFNMEHNLPIVRLHRIDITSKKNVVPVESVVAVENTDPITELSESEEDPFQTDEDSVYLPSSEDSSDEILEDEMKEWEVTSPNIEANKRKNDYHDSHQTRKVYQVLSEGDMIEADGNNTCEGIGLHSMNYLKKINLDGNITNKTKRSKNIGNETKQHCCFVCHKLVTKLPKHLYVHKNVPEVQQVLSLPKGSSDRKSKLYGLQKKGDFFHNSNNDKSIIAVRRQVDTTQCVPCPFCKGYYSKKNLRNHIRLNCQPNRNKKRNLKALSRAIQPRMSAKANDIMKHSIFPKFREDSITNTIRYDDLLIAFGNTLCIKYSTSSHHHKMIRQRLRHLGKLLQTVKCSTPDIKDMASLLDPKFFDDVTKGIQEMAGLNNSIGEFRAPSNASNSCTLLLQVAETSKFEAIKSGDVEREKKVDSFIFLLQKSMNPLINKIAIENRTQRQRQKVVTLPRTEDVNMFFGFLCDEIRKNLEKLSVQFDLETWNTLAKCTLASLLIFNRKRPGEIERAQLLDYKNFEIVNEQTKKFLGDKEKTLAAIFGRFRIRGKLNRTVPVVVSKVMKCGIDTLLHFREKACVPLENKYLFGKCDDSGLEVDTTFSANAALNELKGNFPGAANITATKLRKHLATVSNELKLDDREISNVTDFMGHDTAIHKKIYRQIPVVRDVVDVAPVLISAIGITADDTHIFEDCPEVDFSHGNSVTNLSTIYENPHNEEELNEKEQSKEINENHLPSKRRRLPTKSTHIFEDCPEVDFSHRNSVTNLSTIYENPHNEEELNEEEQSKEINENHLPSKKRRLPTKSLIPKKTWSTPEKQIVRKIFTSEIENKEVPTIEECIEAIANNSELNYRTPKQIQLWVLSETNRKAESLKGRKQNRWTTPEKEACRKHFKRFYLNNEYPSIENIREAIREVPALQCRTPRRLKSHLQHDLSYLRRNSRSIQSFT